MGAHLSCGRPAQTALVNIQYLRGVAAMMVVWVHAREQFSALKLQFPSAAGGNGVDLFFVISGFIMVYTTYGKNITPTLFIQRRFARIAPLYWLATMAILVIGLTAPNMLKSTVIYIPHVIGSFLFWPMPSPKFIGDMWPLLVPGWTLNYEMAFYVVFGLTFFAPRVLRLFFLCGGIFFAVIFGILFDYVGVLRFYTDAIILTFAAGAILGHLHCLGHIPKNKVLGCISVLAGVFLWWALQYVHVGHRFIGAGIPAVLVVAGACTLPNLRGLWIDWLRHLGDASYSIYIGHVFILGIVALGWRHAFHPVSSEAEGVVFMLGSVLVCGVVGVGIHKFLENPLNKWVSKRLK